MENEVDIRQILMHRIEEESMVMDKLEETDDGYKQASQNFREFMKLVIDIERDTDNFLQADENRKVDEAERANRLELEHRKLDLEERKMILEEAKLNTEVETAENEIDMRKAELKHQQIDMIVKNSLTVLGLVVSSGLVMKTLNVNLEGIITDREALSSANKLLGLFVRK